MNSISPVSRDELLQTVFSDDPAPDIHAAVVVSHCGDECLGASWLLSRLYDRASVFRLTGLRDGSRTADAITLTGLPAERCFDLGLEAGTLAKDLETLVWLVSANVKSLEPRMLVTHVTEGVNLDHDAVAFAVRMTALLLPRFGAAAPVVLEFECHHDGPEVPPRPTAEQRWEQGVRIDFGPDSRRLKERILVDQLGSIRAIDRRSLHTEFYRPQQPSDLAEWTGRDEQRYRDAAEVSVGEFRNHAAAVVRAFSRAQLIAG
jgi:hypothetical protein